MRLNEVKITISYTKQKMCNLYTKINQCKDVANITKNYKNDTRQVI